jgi:hypothetical protein
MRKTITDTIKFPGGGFLVTPAITSQHQHLNTATCLLTATLNISYKISLGTGSGHATISDLETTARNSHGACSLSKTLVAQQVFVSGQAR